MNFVYVASYWYHIVLQSGSGLFSVPCAGGAERTELRRFITDIKSFISSLNQVTNVSYVLEYSFCSFFVLNVCFYSVYFVILYCICLVLYCICIVLCIFVLYLYCYVYCFLYCVCIVLCIVFCIVFVLFCVLFLYCVCIVLCIVFVLFCVLFLLLHIAVSFLFLYKSTDHSQRMKTQLQ